MTDRAGPAGDGSAASEGRSTVAIIGGGFSGAVLAHQLARRAPNLFRIVVVEPRERLGGGVAYSTADPAHRINVPATRMTFVPSDPCHFDRWLKADVALQEDPEALTPDGRAFPRRAVFGRYAYETIEPYLLSEAVEHRRALAQAIERAPAGGYLVTLEDGAAIEADQVAFCATHPSPQAPRGFAGVAGDPRLIADTQSVAALDAVAADARVLIVGTGLTMADILASLERRGHRGPITAISRNGLLSRGHAATPGEFGSYSIEPSRTALSLLRRVRANVKAAAAAGAPWHHALDGARNQGQTIWAALPVKERRRLVRRLRTFWDVHRFRVAPQVEASIKRLRDAGQLSLVVGEAVAATATDEAVTVDLKLRRGSREARAFDAILLATGPAHRSLFETSPLAGSLAREGLARLDAVGLGLETNEASAAIGANGEPTPGFWIAGPLARGTFGELMGLPEVARHSEAVAGRIIKHALALPEDAFEAA